MRRGRDRKKPKQPRLLISPVLFIMIFTAMLLFSWIHTQILIFLVRNGAPRWVQGCLPLLYWLLVATGVTALIRHEIRVKYEQPIRRLAEAATRVANGDFSVYVPTVHTSDRHDYLDQLILDFDRMVEELGSTETLQSDFLANVSHEVKTPLAVIQSNAELLQKGKLTPQRQLECAEAIISSTKRLSELVSNMLKLNRLEKQVIQPQFVEYDLCVQLEDCLLQLEHVWDEKQIEITVEMEEHRSIQADPGLLELVWTNLLANAFKFTARGGSVTLRESLCDGFVKVSVIDSGCGMDEKTMEHIFEKFYQGDSSHSTEGNGLGLALVKRVLDILGGTVTVESAPGCGSTFTVRLPAGATEKDATEGRHG